MQNREKRKKTTYDEAKTKTISKNEPLKPQKSVNSSHAWSQNHEKRKKMTSYQEGSEQCSQLNLDTV